MIPRPPWPDGAPAFLASRPESSAVAPLRCIRNPCSRPIRVADKHDLDDRRGEDGSALG
jgi:hypothetical protein